jgi:predicted membrane-bound mannosyltransferase
MLLVGEDVTESLILLLQFLIASRRALVSYSRFARALFVLSSLLPLCIQSLCSSLIACASIY